MQRINYQPKTMYCLALVCLMGLTAFANGGGKDGKLHAGREEDTTHLKLPAGFTAVTVAEHLGHARHLAVAPNGVIFVKLNRPKEGKGIIRLQDGKITGFGNYGG